MDGREAAGGEVIFEVEIGVVEGAEGIDIEERGAVVAEVVPGESAGAAKIVEDFESDVVVAAIVVVLPKTPLPSHAKSGFDGVGALVAGDGARLEVKFVAGGEEASAEVDVFVIGAEGFVVAAERIDHGFAKHGAEAADAAVVVAHDGDGMLAEVLKKVG